MSVNKVNQDTTLKRIAGGTLYADAPLGTILAYGGATAPAGWMLCQGQALSRTTYAKLYEIIGTAFGSGDGSTTFNLPDMRESVPKGAGETGKTVGAHVKSGGLAVGEFLDDRLQEHKHMVKVWSVTSGSSGCPDHTNNINDTTTTTSYTLNVANARKGDTTEVKSVGVNYIIKVMMVSLPADLKKDVEDSMEINPTLLVNAAFSTTETTNNTDLSAYKYLMFYVGYSSTPSDVKSVNIVDQILIPTKIFEQQRTFALTYSEGVSVTITPRTTGFKYSATASETSRRLIVWAY